MYFSDNLKYNIEIYLIISVFQGYNSSELCYSVSILIIICFVSDIDECAIYGMCDQRCSNHPGSYTCHCEPGYKLDADNHTCRATGKICILTLILTSTLIVLSFNFYNSQPLF